MGLNDRGTKYDDLGLILRDADHIDRFIRNAKDPPQPHSKQTAVEEHNRQAGERWSARKRQEAGDDTG